MRHFALTLIITTLFFVDLFAQSDNYTYCHFLKADSNYVLVDNTKGNWFTLEFKADTLRKTEDNRIIYNNKKILQINVIPFTKILSNQKSSITIPKALQAYKKWELDYQQKKLESNLKSGEEFYYHDKKPFLIWWHKNPPDSKNNTFEENEKKYDIETANYVDVKTLKVTHMLCLNFSIYGEKNVAFSIPVYEDENLEEEIEKLKVVANSLRVYGGNIDMDVLMNIKKSKEKYILRDSLNFLELEVPEWLNIIKPKYKNNFIASFPEKYEVVHAMSILWEYKSDSLTFNDFVNRGKLPHNDKYKEPHNYRLIEENDSTLRYFYTSDNGWFYKQNVYLKGDNIYCFINFTATKDTYDYNIEKFDEIIKKIKIKK